MLHSVKGGAIILTIVLVLEKHDLKIQIIKTVKTKKKV